MGEGILSKYTERRSDPTSDLDLVTDSEADTGVTGACYGCIRGNPRERAVMLELRKADGRIIAIGYAWLERIEFDPSDGITLRLGAAAIRIKGRNLNRTSDSRSGLFSGLTTHRVVWIREAGRVASVAAEDEASVVDVIEW